MKKYSFLLLIIIIIPLFSFKVVNGQQTLNYREPDAGFKTGLELFDKEKYGAAKDVFDEILNYDGNTSSEMLALALYYKGLCAYELYHKDARYLFNEFIREYPENTKVQHIYFQLGKLDYRNKKYKQALKSFENVEETLLTDDDLAEYYFKKGYAYLKTDQIEKAKESFSEIIDADTKFRGPANYYYAHLAYLEGDYETALNGFELLDEDETFKNIVPYYIVYIHYLTGDYEKVVEWDNPELLNDKSNRSVELTKMIGDAYFKSDQYEKAIPYFENYTKLSREREKRADWYQLGIAYYETQDYQKAIKAFEKTTFPLDSLAQNSLYHLGYCYIMTDQMKFASNAFLSAFKLDYDLFIKEDALFNWAKIAYELSFDPYNEAINALKQYLKDYPDSERADDAYSFLMNLYMSTNNFKDALESIEKVEEKDTETKTAYQKLTHNRGIELFNQRNYKESISLFKQSLDYNYDKTINAANYFWIAEAYYRLSSYDFAIDYYKRFQSMSSAKDLEYYNQSSYNLGYAYYKKDNYMDAKMAFREFINKGCSKTSLISDAYARIGDCYYIRKDFEPALRNYDLAIRSGGREADYSYLQKAETLGGMGKLSDKISVLKEMISKYPSSKFIPDAIYQIAISYTILDDEENALKYYKSIVNNWPQSRHVSKSRLKIGLIYYAQNQHDLAINTFKGIITDFPSSIESREALVSLRNIYVDMNNVDEYFRYASTLPFADVTINEQDSLLYMSSENLYMAGNCQKAIEGFNTYINRFPQGAFIQNAHYYKADCEIKANNLEQALQSYRFIAGQPPSEFSEKAILRAAEINYEFNNYVEALDLYAKLEEIASKPENDKDAKTGLMRTNFILENFDQSIVEATKVMGITNIDESLEVEAHYVKATSAFKTGNNELALQEYENACSLSQGELAAESQYYIALIHYSNEELEQAEEETFVLINQYSSYDEWFARGFILLADIYVKTGNLFQAKHTLQSIIDNYQGDDLKQIAIEKLNAILEMEKIENTPENEENEEVEEGEF